MKSSARTSASQSWLYAQACDDCQSEAKVRGLHLDEFLSRARLKVSKFRFFQVTLLSGQIMILSLQLIQNARRSSPHWHSPKPCFVALSSSSRALGGEIFSKNSL
mmetsp:Transcript_9584/g.13391  ORF Transcript_9584/g.13391 Transcript_9584/m.13391 type:complete len:105 (+) Transcript_9584:311-625(+)